MPPSKAEQIAEAQGRIDRKEVPRDGNPSDGIIEQSAETTGPDDVGTEGNGGIRAQEQTEERQAPQVRPDPRAEIAKRFSERRVRSEEADDVAELRAFANQGVPPEMTAQSEPEQQQTEQTEQPLVVKRKVKVRGQELELSEEELLAAAQRGLAGDSYMDEARRKADEASSTLTRVNTLLQQTEQRVRGPAAEHPGSETTETPAPGTEASGEHPAEEAVDPWVDAVKQLQFEAPEEAAKTLKTIVEGVVAKGAKQGAQETLREDRRRDELARNFKTLEDLKTKHPDIASDPKAVAAVKTDVAAMQYEDLKALGFTEAQLPNPTDQKELGRWHLHYRHEGAKVRPMNDLMETAVSDFRKWKGTPAETPQDQIPTAKPRVEVKVDRTQRRETIPQQPNRSVTPRADQGQPQQRSRSEVVAAMARRRAEPRGRVVA
jgi:hypothetical protein